MSLASHHQHIRKRKMSPKHTFPTVNPKIKLLDDVVTVVSFLFPLSALPQIYNIWILKNVQGVSLLTWVLFFIMQIPLVIYAIVHQEKRLRTMFTLWCIVYAIAIIGIIVYS